jgi:hypothetical protein
MILNILYLIKNKTDKILILSMCFLIGCASASYVINPDQKSGLNRPEGYRPFGIVKYLNQGADFIINSRREDSFKKMAESCNNKYKILSEGEKPDTSLIVMPVGNTWVASGFNYWYFIYECLN